MQLYLAMMSDFISGSAINPLHVLCKISHVLLSCLNVLKIYSLRHATLLEYKVKRCSLEKAVDTVGRKCGASKKLPAFKLAGLQ